MSTIPAIQSAYQGIQNGMQSLNKNAFAVASESTKGGDFVTPMVEINSDKLQVQASAKALQISSDTLGSLLDIKV
ncbi:MAG TPA: hypothetical protein DCE77_11650 [Methylophaga sp.]|jgi:hypothetical protein|uniref:hypothetical protein n=1 Tax=unclassified Methylophaga TaxID=2629249 RepID=UPI000C92CCB4|nr:MULTISPECIES: hypothetical protein [unclassified Methylophaga]MAP27178.1 hypothetical protein [Methylophaga sp.]HAD32219.1 hypothetical protein [Methylophaga sp.]HBX60936.1 hypothetical protein [Methylophaga sp.]HCO01439.1 hypothetical protein [Methylophaga sp.]|tara:strand:- start:16643 stop:16867 length:225 start_codon:yes stop_codon:yes gene_type:complete